MMSHATRSNLLITVMVACVSSARFFGIFGVAHRGPRRDREIWSLWVCYVASTLVHMCPHVPHRRDNRAPQHRTQSQSSRRPRTLIHRHKALTPLACPPARCATPRLSLGTEGTPGGRRQSCLPQSPSPRPFARGCRPRLVSTSPGNLRTSCMTGIQESW